MAGTGTYMDQILPANIWDALLGANSPGAGNVFATMADLPAPGNTLYTGDGSTTGVRTVTLGSDLVFQFASTFGSLQFIDGGALILRTSDPEDSLIFFPDGITDYLAVNTENLVSMGFRTTHTIGGTVNSFAELITSDDSKAYLNISADTSSFDFWVNNKTTFAGTIDSFGNWGLGGNTTASSTLTVNGRGNTSASIGQIWKNSGSLELARLNDAGQLGINTSDFTTGVGGITTHFAVRAENGNTGYHTLGFFENTLTPTVNNAYGNRTLTISAKKLGSFNTYEVSGLYNAADNQGSGTISEFYGSRSYVLQRGTGSTITYGSGYYSDKQLNDGNVTYFSSFTADCTAISGGNVYKLIGFYAKTPTNISAGIRTESYAFYAQQNNAATSNYGVVVNGTMSNGFGIENPNAAAILDLTSTTKGFLPPRMTQAQRDAIVGTPASLLVYNTDTNKINFYNGAAWEQVTSA